MRLAGVNPDFVIFMPHDSLYALSLQYGPLMTLRLGMRTTVVVSSPTMAKEILKTYDNILVGWPVIEINKNLSHDKSSLIWVDCGPYWHHLRLISNVELFSPKRLEALQHRTRRYQNQTLIFSLQIIGPSICAQKHSTLQKQTSPSYFQHQLR
ncbi:hypothetical protein SUGI_0555110 [Cryptomeria japonica]|nr:hypothetical protein SUGI_0555110 [Cryptomeria japonica]